MLRQNYCFCRFLGIAMVVCFIWIVLMRWLTGIIVWFSIFAVLGVLSYGKQNYNEILEINCYVHDPFLTYFIKLSGKTEKLLLSCVCVCS